MAVGIVFNIEEFGVHDGPGIRKIVFLKGCNLECNWCHNPEGISFIPEELTTRDGRKTMCGVKYEARELAEFLKKGADVLINSGGGITISGGEPLAQPEFLFDLMQELKPLHLVVESSGHAAKKDFKRMLELADLVFMDIKVVDAAAHELHTGSANNLILENLKSLKKGNTDFVIRVPLIPGVSDTYENMERTANLLAGSRHLKKVELLPYHKTAGAKYSMVGKDYHPKFDEASQVNIHLEAFNRMGIPVEVL